MIDIRLAGIIILLALVCIPASGFKPYCDCSDMGGEWVTSEELYENGDPTNQIEQENMVLTMNGCAAVGTLADIGAITNAYFAGGVANNLVGKWSFYGSEMGTFAIQLLSGE